jgi:CRP-like cAMP-binding protein/Fe-S-cluster-containing hydrogenase component 2
MTRLAPGTTAEQPLTASGLAELDIFREVAARRPELLARATGVRRRQFAAGQIVCLEGEMASTAFYVLSGAIELFITPPPSASRSWIAALRDRFHSWMEGVTRTRQAATASEPAGQETDEMHRPGRKPRTELPDAWVLLDSPRPFDYRRPAAVLPAGSLFDELTCLSAAREKRTDVIGRKLAGTYPRPAAARARGTTVLLELDWPAILALREAGPLKAQLDEAMKKVTASAKLGAGEPLGEDELRAVQIRGIKPFEAIARVLSDQPGSVVRRRYKPGDVVCRQGEFGSTAFLIEEGLCKVFLERRAAVVRQSAEQRAGGGAAGAASVPPASSHAPDDPHLANPKSRLGDMKPETLIRTDSGDLPGRRPIAVLGEGELFGEMTCMNFYPRAATVVAETDCTLLELLRNVLDMLKRSGPYKDKLDNDYRQRSLGNHLRAVPLFRELPDETIEGLKRKATFALYSRFDKDQKEHADPAKYTICSEGDPADAFYLVRAGTVRVSNLGPGGEIVLPYLARGDYFGEIGLLAGGKRTATCQAIDHVELVKIARADFDDVLARFPDVKRQLVEVAIARASVDEERTHRFLDSNLAEFVRQGLMTAQDLLVIDLNSCTRCDACVQACAATHGGVSRLPRDGQRFESYLVTAACRSCRDPLCMIGCPVGSIRRKDSKEIVIEDWCIGCERCANQCPYGSISMHYFRVEEPGSAGNPRAIVKKQATGCDLCSGYVEPNCVHACPHGAALRVEPRRFFGSAAHRVAGRDQSWGRS